MPSQEEIRICEPADNLNHIFSYESDLKSQFYPSLCHQNGLVEQPSSQLNKGFPRADNYTSHKSTHQLNTEAVCTMCPSKSVIFFCTFEMRTRDEIIVNEREKTRKYNILLHLTW